MAKSRKEFTPLQRRQLQKEANNECAWCGNKDPEDWQFHHIDGNPEMTVLANGIMLCRNCHGKADNGYSITMDQLYIRKSEFQKAMPPETEKSNIAGAKKILKSSLQSNEVNVGIVGGDFVFSPKSEVHIHQKPRKSTVTEKYPDGTIGSDMYAHGYSKYLAKKATEAQIKSNIKATPQKFYTLFARDHGLTPFFSLLEKLPAAIEFMQKKIDGTRFARGLGYKFYHTFDEHKAMIDNPKGRNKR